MGNWPSPSGSWNDTRALQDPGEGRDSSRHVGFYSVALPWNPGWEPSFPIDIELQPWAEGRQSYQVALYLVDFDSRGRRQTVTAMDRWGHQEVSPVQLVEDFVGGVWLVYSYTRSMRFRFNYIRGDNQVVSAILFD